MDVSHPQTHYTGEILSNITAFGIVQNLLDKPKEAKLFHLMDLESVIEALLFHERILVIDPTSLTTDVNIQMPNIINELVGKNLMEIYSPKFNTTHIEELSSLLEEAPELKNSQLVRKIYSSGFGNYYEKLAPLYDQLFRIREQTKFPALLECLRQRGVTDKNAVPLYIQLLQTRIYLKCLHALEKQGIKMPYLPHAGRISLTEWMSNLFGARTLPVAREIIKKLELSEKQKREALDQTWQSTLELKLPILTTLILSQCKEPSDILDEILNMRKNGKVKRFRDYCNKFQNMIYNNDQKAIEEYDQRLKITLSELYPELPKNGIALRLLKSTPQIAFDVSTVNIPSVLSRLASSPSELLRYLRKRDLLFLGDLQNRLYGIKRSVAEFERVFQAELKM